MNNSCLEVALREFDCLGGENHVIVTQKGDIRQQQNLLKGGFT